MKVLFFPVGEPPRMEDIPNTLDGIYKLLGCDCIDMPRLDRDVTLVCSDTGMIDNLPPNVWAEGPTYEGAPIFGPCFVSGFDGEDFRDISVRQVSTYSMLRRAKRYDYDRQAMVFE